MACFLIDYENQQGRALEGISYLKLKKSDEIVLFYSKTAGRIPIELHLELEKLKTKKEYILAETGHKNSLDFQLSTYLGMRISENPNEEYYIVSSDTGFDSVCFFWCSRGNKVIRLSRFSHYLKNEKPHQQIRSFDT